MRRIVQVKISRVDTYSTHHRFLEPAASMYCVNFLQMLMEKVSMHYKLVCYHSINKIKTNKIQCKIFIYLYASSSKASTYVFTSISVA